VNDFWAYVDVRDVALAHVRAYEHPQGGRFFITGGNFTYKQVADIIRDIPDVDKSKVSKDDPILEWPEVYKVDNSKARSWRSNSDRLRNRFKILHCK
jgi:nucleoside-diphosphate-sugar epimerase